LSASILLMAVTGTGKLSISNADRAKLKLSSNERARAMDAHQRARLWAVLGVAAFALGLLFWMAVGGIPD
jgi:hypothetical protein